MMEEHLTIGAVAAVTGLTVKALRHYDEIGLLRPDHVDPRTGYRHYSRGQLRDAALIASLRLVDMPLADIAVALTSRAALRDQLGTHRTRLLDQVADIERHVRDVDRLEETLLTDIEIRQFATTPIYRVSLQSEDAEGPLTWPTLPEGGALLTWGDLPDGDRLTVHFAVENPAIPNDTVAGFEAAVAVTNDPARAPATIVAVLEWIATERRTLARPPVVRLIGSPHDGIELWLPLGARARRDGNRSRRCSAGSRRGDVSAQGEPMKAAAEA